MRNLITSYTNYLWISIFIMMLIGGLYINAYLLATSDFIWNASLMNLDSSQGYLETHSFTIVIASVILAITILPQNVKTVVFYFYSIYKRKRLETCLFFFFLSSILGITVANLIVYLVPSILILVVLTFYQFYQRKKIEHEVFELATDRYPDRTRRQNKLLLKSLEGYSSINISATWGAGKTFFLKRFYNDIVNKPSSMLIPIYIGLDKLDSTETILKSFKKQISKKVYLLSGIKIDFDVSKFVKLYSSHSATNIVTDILHALLPNSLDIKDSFKEIPEIANKRWVIIIDDLDRVITFDEIKFVLEFMQYLIDTPGNSFKIVTASDNSILHPLIGYQLMSKMGYVEDIHTSNSKRIAQAIRKQESSSGIFIRDGDAFALNARAMGANYMDKYSEVSLVLPPMSDKKMTEKFFEEITPYVNSSRILTYTKQKFLKLPIPFKGDIRKQKLLLQYVQDTETDYFIKEEISLGDYIILVWNIIQNPQLWAPLHNDDLRVASNNELYYEIDNSRYYFKLSDNLENSSNKNALLNLNNLDKYKMAINLDVHLKLSLTDKIEFS